MKVRGLLRYILIILINSFKLKVERADGVASVTYQGSVAFSDTKTRTISFPLNLEIRTYWSTYGYTNLPAGRYRLTVTDACGATTVREYQLGAVWHNAKV